MLVECALKGGTSSAECVPQSVCKNEMSCKLFFFPFFIVQPFPPQFTLPSSHLHYSHKVCEFIYFVIVKLLLRKRGGAVSILIPGRKLWLQLVVLIFS